MEHEEPFGTLPGELPPQPPDELVDPRVTGVVLPVEPPSSAHRIPSRYRRSTGASVIAAGLIGLRDVIDPAKVDDTVIEQPAADRSTSDDMEIYLDPDDPAASMVVIRDPADLN